MISVSTTFGVAWYENGPLIALLTLITAAATAAVFYRQLRSMTKKNDFDALLRASQIFNGRFAQLEGGPPAFYGLRYLYKAKSERSNNDAANPSWGSAEYRKSLLKRLEIVAMRSEDQRTEDLAAVRPVVNALNDLAELIDLDFVEPRMILSKYHLAIAREVFIAEPFIHYEVIFADRGRWGFRVLRLGEMARKYNDMNPIHRGTIYFLDGERPDRSFGGIYSSPDTPWLWLLRPYWAVRRRLGYPTINERVKRRQNRRMKAIEDRLHHFRRDPKPPPSSEA